MHNAQYQYLIEVGVYFYVWCAGNSKYSNVDLNTSSLKMYWNVAKQAGGQEHWRKLLMVSGKRAQINF